MIKIIYEDNNLIVVDKPAGLVVHPGAGKEAKTLSGWLVSEYPPVSQMPWPEKERIGIVHRLDKDTSGLIVMAKNPEALEKLQNLFQNHQVVKKYLALISGKLEKKEGEIEGLIGRDPHARRQQISSTIHFDFQPGKVRDSKTYYKVVKEYHYKKYDLALAEATLDTGRMHQIRVHFKSIGHPLIGDPVYNIKHSRIVSKALGLNRQFLHSYKLSFRNPFDEKLIDLQSDLPQDLKDTLEQINE